ncbi:agmatine/peptidylarginine deiminase [Dokdonella fugitiva]|uniref:Agmatine/peptidylarginine deiminase n=1 Tax=Dokdonella fugitiva TaxID=328517 RepID=A0A839EWR7_9GAMM|nr:agmatine deiminase family protein [Dokdonella fugitiva]MBA8886212.1 agmatine/peptidylarginine deiminase [Dokdonella fugitiva]
MASSLRLPAEWEPQAGVIIAWPHADTDWGPRLARIERAYVGLAAAIARFEPLVVCVADTAVRSRATALLAEAGVANERLRFVEIAYDDTWLRDSGPLTLAAAGRFQLLDFRFTGWGGKYEGGRDDRLVETLHARGLFGDASHRRIDWALEGGAIEVDGKGSLLTTWRCLHQRHPHMDRAEMDALLRDAFAVERVLWLEHGYLEGDDTDAHIDTLARYAPGDAIVLQTCDDPADPHHAELARMREEIAALRTLDGRPYRLHELPWARAIVDGGRRLAASYANYLVVDGGVVMPAYGDPSDAAAARVIAAAHPGRDVVAVDARELIWQNGSVHCLTMQLPAGALAA